VTVYQIGITLGAIFLICALALGSPLFTAIAIGVLLVVMFDKS